MFDWFYKFPLYDLLFFNLRFLLLIIGHRCEKLTREGIKEFASTLNQNLKNAEVVSLNLGK